MAGNGEHTTQKKGQIRDGLLDLFLFYQDYTKINPCSNNLSPWTNDTVAIQDTLPSSSWNSWLRARDPASDGQQQQASKLMRG